MAQDFSVKFDDNIRKFASEFSTRLGPELTMGMMRAAQQVQTSVKQKTAKILNKNPKGRLMNSWEIGPIKTSSDRWSIDVFSMVPYAAIHQWGGVIRPRRVKALAIPDRNYSPIIRNAAPIAPREFDPGRTRLRFRPVRNPGRVRGLLVDKHTGERAYTLVSQSRIYPTSYMSLAVEDAIPEIHAEIVGVMEAAKVAAAGSV